MQVGYPSPSSSCATHHITGRRAVPALSISSTNCSSLERWTPNSAVQMFAVLCEAVGRRGSGMDGGDKCSNSAHPAGRTLQVFFIGEG
ncbi:hypothetical protein E2C01_057775 [Portunus trituberculatus]|uniref:Uncharacterized protein n=1 Tax=Portunus trituberculatus TaxID=210409 RepID=A0A5B7H4A5_PORTR|nr:hypothetical protein [Portunus trituberculatus]